MSRIFFHRLRGVRHGDPLSPLLIVLVVNFYHTLLIQPDIGALNLLIPLIRDNDLPPLNYIYGTLIFMQGDVN